MKFLSWIDVDRRAQEILEEQAHSVPIVDGNKMASPTRKVLLQSGIPAV